jgi:hypothetical protein
MALPSSGQIGLSDVNVELTFSSNATITMNDTSVRVLFGQSSGPVDMDTGHGKSNRVTLAYSFTSDTQNASLDVTTLPGYISGKSNVTITVASAIYLYSTSTATPGLTITGGVTGDNIFLVNNGFILGMGGAGGCKQTTTDTVNAAGGNGGDALSLGCNINLTNNSYIAGGGGGGSGGAVGDGGGGGAGGGQGGGTFVGTGSYNAAKGGAGGNPGSAGGTVSAGSGAWSSIPGIRGGGGGGGRILPGTGGSPQFNVTLNLWGGTGGGAGGAGGSWASQTSGQNDQGGSGGSAGGAGSAGSSVYSSACSGGGGWGAAGGSGYSSGGAGGKGIKLNGYTCTQLVTGTIYGSVV